jgi:hypothetical protein
MQSVRRLWDGLLTHPEDSYRLRYVEVSVIVKPGNEESLAYLTLLRHKNCAKF